MSDDKSKYDGNLAEVRLRNNKNKKKIKNINNIYIARFESDHNQRAAILPKEEIEENVFKSKTEATAYINKSKKFCPLIRSKCNHDCVCYKEGSTTKVRGRFKVIIGECTNMMFKRKG